MRKDVSCSGESSKPLERLPHVFGLANIFDLEVNVFNLLPSKNEFLKNLFYSWGPLFETLLASTKNG